MPTTNPPDDSANRLLAADLDGTLHASDVAAHLLAQLLVTRPWYLLALPLWLARGRLYLKTRIERLARLRPERLDWNDEVIGFVVEQAAAGRKIALATGAMPTHAAAAAAHLADNYQVNFDHVLSSDAKINLIGKAKADALVALAADGFDYIGDSPTQDPPLFARAHTCHLVNPTARLARQFATPASRIFSTRISALSKLRHRLLSLLQTKG